MGVGRGGGLFFSRDKGLELEVEVRDGGVGGRDGEEEVEHGEV